MTGVPFRCFMVIGAMRTGSNLLQEGLNALPGVRCFGELFNPHFIDKAGKSELWGVSLEARDADPLAFVTEMQSRGGENLCGFRYFEGHNQGVFEALLSDINCAKIILRRDPLDSFVSWKIAQKTGQWLLRDATARKTATIKFDAGEFQRFRDGLDGFYETTEEALAASGQGAFHIDYHDLLDVQALNAVGRFLGVKRGIKAFQPKLQRQNPNPIEELVDNPEDLPKTAKLAGRAERGGILDVVHPVALAYQAFAENIFTPSSERFGYIRQTLCTYYDLDLPDVALCQPDAHDELLASGYTRGQHRTNFHRFLKFLRANLARETPVYIAPEWMPQTDTSRYAQKAAVVAAAPFTLAEIATRQTENLTRKAYGTDYEKFGFSDYKP